MTYIRERKDGGFSSCSSPEELVGKGRCVHISGEGHTNMEISKIQRGMYEVKVNDEKMTIEAQKETIMKFFDDMPKISDEKRNKILEFLNNE